MEAIGRLIQQGNPSPGAARVAELAGVSLRTVFRHFEDMDSLYREISLSIRDRVLPAVLRPYRSDTWQGRLDELLERRIALFEAILPYKLAGDLRRHQSPYLEQDHAEHIQMEQASLEPLLPPALLADRRWTNALHMATGFQAWRTLRRDLDLDVPEAKATLKRGVAALLAAADPRPEAAARNTTTPANAGKEGPKA